MHSKKRLRETCICLESRQKTNKLTTTRTKTWLSKSTEKNFFFLLNWRLWLISSDRPWFQLDKAICRRKKFQPLVKKLGGELEKGLLSFSDTTTTYHYCSPIFFSDKRTQDTRSFEGIAAVFVKLSWNTRECHSLASVKVTFFTVLLFWNTGRCGKW